MATTTTGDRPEPITSSRRRTPLRAIVAAARRLTGKTTRAYKAGQSSDDWQSDAWLMFDLVGEMHFLATTLANRIGAARLYAGRLADDPTEPPEPVEDGPVADVFDAFGSSPAARSQLIARLAVNLFVAGDGWFVGIPRRLLPAHRDDDQDSDDGPWITPYGPDGERILALSDLEFRMLSVSEVVFQNRDVQLQLGQGKDEQISVSPDDVFLVRVWRPHARKWWEADSPTRASLPILRELVGLTEHVSAQVDSRLAGAGMLIMPNSVRDALLQRTGVPEDDEDDADPFTESLMDAMITPIKDRSNASAIVPLPTYVPDDAADKIRLITFTTPLDAEARQLREEALRRYALSSDCPPELLLGSEGESHWASWLTREDVVTSHVTPPLALICDALTTQFLRPVLIQQGMDPDEAEQYVVWYDVDHLIMRPNRVQDAQNLHAAGVISDEAYRDAAGFSDADAPAEDDPAVTLAFELVKGAPSLAQVPGLPALVDQIRQVLTGQPADPAATTEPDGEPVPDDGEGDMRPPSQTIGDVDLPEDTDSPPPDIAASARLRANWRALETLGRS